MTCGTKDGETHLYTPLRAIRRKCLDCCCGSSMEVGLCHIKKCALHPYRFGKRPGTVKQEATPAQIERLRKARTARLNARISDPPLSEDRENVAKGRGATSTAEVLVFCFDRKFLSGEVLPSALQTEPLAVKQGAVVP